MHVLKSLIVAALLIGSLLLGLLVASATAGEGMRLAAADEAEDESRTIASGHE